MKKTTTFLATLAALACCSATPAQTAAPAQPAAKTVTAPAVKPTAKPAGKPAGKPAVNKPAAAAAAEPELPLTEGQLAAAERVYLGTAECDESKQVVVNKVDGKSGYFKLDFAKASYTVAPEETTSGAVRLEDKKSGIVWIQIPAKSMLMNAKMGHRVADGCVMAEQKPAPPPVPLDAKIDQPVTDDCALAEPPIPCRPAGCW